MTPSPAPQPADGERVAALLTQREISAVLSVLAEQTVDLRIKRSRVPTGLAGHEACCSRGAQLAAMNDLQRQSLDESLNAIRGAMRALEAVEVYER